MTSQEPLAELDDCGGGGSPCRVGRQLLSNVQILRFLAAFGVMVSHAAFLFVPHVPFGSMFPWTGRRRRVLRHPEPRRKSVTR